MKCKGTPNDPDGKRGTPGDPGRETGRVGKQSVTGRQQTEKKRVKTMNHFSDKVIYQIYLRSFKDSNGDGIGDIRGITQQLDYLQSLGVDYLWITPFFVSPQNDNGYDVADYRKIDPVFGTMEDLEELIREAKERGIELMLDMVFNHTSTSHEWFQKAIAGDEKYQNYYIFKDGTPD